MIDDKVVPFRSGTTWKAHDSILVHSALGNLKQFSFCLKNLIEVRVHHAPNLSTATVLQSCMCLYAAAAEAQLCILELSRRYLFHMRSAI